MGKFFRHHFPYVWSHLIFNGTIDHFLGQLWSSSVTQQWCNDLLLISYVCFVSGANTLTDLQVQKKERAGVLRVARGCRFNTAKHDIAHKTAILVLLAFRSDIHLPKDTPHLFITVVSHCVKSPATRLFLLIFFLTDIKERMKAPYYWLIVRQFPS